MNSVQQQERQDVWYPLNLHVSLKLGRQEMQVHSENISLGGILLSSAFPIPERTTVDLVIGVSRLTLLSARGKVCSHTAENLREFRRGHRVRVPVATLSALNLANDPAALITVDLQR